MGRKRKIFNENKMMDDLALLLIENAVEENDDKAVDLLEQCLIPVGQPPIPWRGIIAQMREKKDRGGDPALAFEERGYNLRFLPMVI